MIRLSLIKRLRREEKGATLVEFAIVAPVLILMIMGIFDMAHSQYTSALINGAMQKAGRDLTLESAGSNEQAIDTLVTNQIMNVAPASATITLDKLAHFDFSDIGEAEQIVEDDGNQICDPGETYIDSNGNGQ
ncbi:MAG: TadE/TadG family type IV pilus assembly protein, partial [Pseudomonadota bacterium]